jgi:integrase
MVYLATTRYPARDRVMFLLSLKAGLRAKEMASLTWAMVTDAAGQVAEVMHVPNRASKGKRSYWIPGSWNVRMVYTDAIPFYDP